MANSASNNLALEATNNINQENPSEYFTKMKKSSFILREQNSG